LPQNFFDGVELDAEPIRTLEQGDWRIKYLR
jgi:hypothetical protein